VKAITLIQPWATLVAIGAKRLETRSWRTDYRGPIAIHSSKRFTRAEQEICENRTFRAALIGHRLVTGCIVATATLRGCFATPAAGVKRREYPFAGLVLPPDEPERSFGDFSPGRYAWLLEDVRELAEPIPAKGSLGLWDWDDNAIEGQE
jgi:hypothetical protein